MTGATGLLGREVVRAFQRAGWEAVGTGFTRARPPSTIKVDLGREEDVVAALEEVKYEAQRVRNEMIFIDFLKLMGLKATGSRSLYDHISPLFVLRQAHNRMI